MGNRQYALWGEDETGYKMNGALLDYISKNVGLEEDKLIWSGYNEVDDLPASSELKDILLSCISPENISFDTGERVKHSAGRSGLDYVAIMEGRGIRTVDAVVFPDEDEIRCILRKGDDRIELIPFGGGTTVTGGVCPSGTRKFAVSIDLSRLNFLKLDRTNNVLEAGPGLKGPQIEDELNKYGLTLGNFPESFYYSTLGGWIATNAAGQESNRYGKTKDMVIGLRMESPTGSYQDRIVPGESAFFRLSDLAVGGEGAFGIVTRAWLKVHRKPEKLFYRAYMFPSFREGLEGMRKKFTETGLPMISRLSDEDETDLSLMGVDDTFLTRLFKNYLEFRMHSRSGSILIAISDRKEETEFEGGIGLTSLPARLWQRERYTRPMMYNELLKRGIVAETIETSGEWGKLDQIHTSSKRRFEEIIDDLGIKGMILCHSSHQYISGSALYFTFLFYSEGNRADILNRIRDGLMESILSSGGSISHHHGIGSLQSKYLVGYKGNLYGLTREVKNFFDPRDSLVPGILGSGDHSSDNI